MSLEACSPWQIKDVKQELTGPIPALWKGAPIERLSEDPYTALWKGIPIERLSEDSYTALWMQVPIERLSKNPGRGSAEGEADFRWCPQLRVPEGHPDWTGVVMDGGSSAGPDLS